MNHPTLAPRGDEGWLRVTLVSKETGEERQSTVCETGGFNAQAAVLFCQSMGYYVKGPVWGRVQSDGTVPLHRSSPKYVGVRHKEKHVNKASILHRTYIIKSCKVSRSLNT